MQRIRIGLTGLAVVFVIVMIAGALVRGASNETPVIQPAGIAEPPAAQITNKSGEANKPVSEPLAELGVAPSLAPADNSATDSGN